MIWRKWLGMARRALLESLAMRVLVGDWPSMRYGPGFATGISHPKRITVWDAVMLAVR